MPFSEGEEVLTVLSPISSPVFSSQLLEYLFFARFKVFPKTTYGLGRALAVEVLGVLAFLE